MNEKPTTKQPREPKADPISFRPLPEVAAVLERARIKWGEQFITEVVEECVVCHLETLLATGELKSAKIQRLLKKVRSRRKGKAS